jgi:peptidoglycan/LPS O-acetylase OafA/YrhL
MATRAAGARPVALRLAAAAQAAEAVGMAVAAVFAAVATADGKSYQLASGIALTLIAFGTAAGLAAFAVALDRARVWSRIPVALTQVFVIIVGFTLLDGRRPEWGVPALLLAVGCLAGLLTPASLRALNRPPVGSQPVQNQPVPNQPVPNQPVPNQPVQNKSEKSQPAKRQPAKGQPAKRQPANRQPAK